jgi:hypothetical protein
MTPAYGDSYTVWCSPTPGTILWPFQFRDGYIDKIFVKARYLGYDDKWYPIKVNPRTSFAEDFVLTVTPVVPPCKMVEIYRDTPKDEPIVIYGFGGCLLANESRNAAARQSIHVVVELKELANRTALECKCECAEGAL